MNQSEIDLLNNRYVSHEARSLYIFEIRSQADATGAYRIDYNRILQVLSIYNATGALSYAPSVAKITSCIQELLDLKILKLAPNTRRQYDDFQDLVVYLPFAFEQVNSNVNYSDQTSISPMFDTWQPSASFPHLAKTAMLIDISYTSSELSEFRAYWMSRPNIRLSTGQWDQKFISFLKRAHSLEINKVTVYREQVGLQRK